MFKRLLVLLISTFSLVSIASSETPTFSEHIAPIIFNHCVTCHRAGEIGPFPLTTYTEVRANAKMIKTEVSNGNMPPWKPVHGYGNFVDERRLTTEEIKSIVDWVDGGSPEGDITKLPKLPNFPTGSQLGTPDMVLQVPVKWHVKGDLKDVYRNFVVPTGLLEDKNIAAIEVRPGNKKVVHHVLMWNDITGTGRSLDNKDATPGYEDFGGPGFDNVAATYPGWAPGTMPRYFPEGIGMVMHKNSDLIIQIHYAPSATDEEDQTSINIFFKKEKEIREVSEIPILPDYLPGGYNAFSIPANQKKTFKGSYTVSRDMSVLGVFPHMHKLGMDAKLYAVTPKNDTIKFINIPSWDFNWQGAYSYKNLIKIPRNSKLYYEATYDNTTANPYNPNTPPKTVKWGFSTMEEMYLCYIFSMDYEAGDENISQETITAANEEQEHTELSPINVRGIFPQPVSNTATSQIQFTLFSNQNISIDVADMKGQIVSSQSFGQLPVGEHSLALPEDINASGAYVCRIHVGENIISVPFSVVK